MVLLQRGLLSLHKILKQQKITTEDFKTEIITFAQQTQHSAVGKLFKLGPWGLSLNSEHTGHRIPLEMLGYN